MVSLSRWKWIFLVLICSLLIGLVLSYQSWRITKNMPPRLGDSQRIEYAFTIDEEFLQVRLGEINQQEVAFIDELLLALFPWGMPSHPTRTLITLREDYTVEIGKQYTLFYYYPETLSDPLLQERVNTLRSELYSDPPPARKKQIREELKVILKHANYIRVMQQITIGGLDTHNHHVHEVSLWQKSP